MKLSPINHKSSVLALETFKSELNKIMILSLKYNKSFFKPKLLVIPSNILQSSKLIQRETISPFLMMIKYLSKSKI